MRSLQISGAHQVNIVEVDVPQDMTAGRVRVRVSRVGLCGTDFALAQGTLGLNTLPVIPGHEVAGVVVESRDGNFSPGDHVVLDPLLNCGNCWACRQNRPQWCDNVGVVGVVRDGGLQEELVLPGSQWIPVPTHLAPDDMVLIEPTHVIDTVLEISPVAEARSVLVIGTGTLGLMLIIILNYLYPNLTVWAYDTVPERLARVQQLNAMPWTETHNLAVDLVIDGVGMPTSLAMAGSAVRPGGDVVIYGVPKPGNVFTTLDELFRKNVHIRFSRLYSHDFSKAVKWVEDGLINSRAVVSERLNLQAGADFLREEKWSAPSRWGKTIVILGDS